jgi:hypothetical protein
MKMMCSICKKTFSGKTELEAEIKFEKHKCKFDVKELTNEELSKLLEGETK